MAADTYSAEGGTYGQPEASAGVDWWSEHGLNGDGATTGQPLYQTTANWQDPYHPPSPGDPYWDEWIAANPTYTGSQTNTWPGGPLHAPTTAATTDAGPAAPGVPSYPTSAPNAPQFEKFSYAPFGEKFTAPSADEAANSPGYQDAIKQAQQALARSAAANGTLLTGGTAKALQQQAVSYANQNYQNVYNNSLTKFNTDASQYQQGLTNALQAHAMNANLSQQQYEDLLQQYGLNVHNFDTGNQLGLQYGNLGLGYNQLGLGYDQLNSSNTNAANTLGLGYAGLYANTAQNGAASYGNYLTQQGNAGAAGTIGAANGYTNFLGNLGNTALYTTLLANGSLGKKPSMGGV